MKLTIDCPHGEYRGGHIYCRKVKDICGNQRFKPCVGWWVLLDNADKCPLREGDKNGQKNQTAAEH